MNLTRWLLLPIQFYLIWQLSARSTIMFEKLRNKRILLLIAHPDDEAMFFAPSLLSLTKPVLGNHVRILCLSNGDAEGLGQIRARELVQSATLLGVDGAHDVLSLDDTRFTDSMDISWDAADISDYLAKHYLDQQTGESLIDTVVTFDARGVSGHPNHISLYHGAVRFVESMQDAPVRLYTLSSVNMVRKYASVLDAPWTMFSAWWTRGERSLDPASLVSVNSVQLYLAGQTAMTQAHKSQMVWFRWGWIGISRYMVVNDLVRHDVRV